MRSTWTPWQQVAASPGWQSAAVHALQARADFLCLGSNFDEAMTNTVIERVVAALDSELLDRAQLELEPGAHRHVARCPRTEILDVESLAGVLVAHQAVAIEGQLPTGPFAVLECRPPGSMACFNVSWGIADGLRAHGWPATTITASDPIDTVCAGCSRPLVICRSWWLFATRVCTVGRPS